VKVTGVGGLDERKDDRARVRQLKARYVHGQIVSRVNVIVDSYVIPKLQGRNLRKARLD